MLNFDQFAVLTFDCYGTLIDWETGILTALVPILTRYGVTIDSNTTLELYGQFETDLESGPYREYRAVLRGVLEAFGAKFGFTPTAAALQSFAESVKNWPAFPDSARALQALRQKYKLAILSNIDDDLFAFSARRLETQFDWVITAQQVKSYKPSLNNFRQALARLGVPPPQILHVAQSLYHDIVPAKELGLATVWVNRRQGQAGFGATPPAQAQADVEVPNLQTLATLIGLSVGEK
jgi:2-haloacid dehalogenase